MKNHPRRLNVILKIFGYDAFYSITLRQKAIDFQGKFDPEIVLLAKKMKFTYYIDTNGYVNLNRLYYTIILT